MKKKGLILGFLLSLSLNGYSDDYLIQEMETLRANLEKNDPDRSELSLRLADLYFDVSIQESDTDVTQKREKALSLYLDVLKGRDGITAVKGKKVDIVKFQIARVLNKLHRPQEAKNYYQEVFDSKAIEKKIKREASFSLAEFYEENDKFENADQYYQEAIHLCESVTSCNYAHYKRAWLYYKEVKIETAISELKLSLFEEDGSVREKILNDLLLFFSANTTNGETELAYILEIEKKLKRNDLVKKLVEAFYSSGNRIAGTTTLVALNERSPDIFYEARLIEEFYGYKDIDLISKYIAFLGKRTQADIPKDQHEEKEFKAMLKRTLVQFDSESQTNKDFIRPLQQLVDQYLTFYPSDEMRIKLEQGWLNVEENEKSKIQKLGKWIKEDTKLNLSTDHLVKMRRTRLSLAQKLDMNDIVLEEAIALSQLYKDDNEKREFEYLVGHQYYLDQKYDKAIGIFTKISDITNISPDKFALLSQNLLLDIYNKKKDYNSLVLQTQKWLTNEKCLVPNKELSKELKQMAMIQMQAKFENAVAKGKSAEALSQFYEFCFTNVFEEKSCQNAKVLSIELKDQGKYISLLEKEKDYKKLKFEYEAMGDFGKAASLQEKMDLGSQSTTTSYLKIALLYELDGDLKNRDRILLKLISKIRKMNKFEEGTEKMVYLTLNQANLINNRTLLLPWRMERKIELANRLNLNSPSKINQKIIYAQKSYAGSTWSKHVLTLAQKLFYEQEKIKFYGRYSKSLFKRRIKKLNLAITYAKEYLEGSDLQTRIYLLDLLKKSNYKIAQEILTTPLPDGLTEEILVQVKNNLQEMANPYLTVSSDYEKLQNEQLDQISDLALKEERKSEITEDVKDYTSFIKSEKYEVALTSTLDFSEFKKKISPLQREPYSKNQLKEIETYLVENNQLRLASYFKGRRESLKDLNYAK